MPVLPASFLSDRRDIVTAASRSILGDSRPLESRETIASAAIHAARAVASTARSQLSQLSHHLNSRHASSSSLPSPQNQPTNNFLSRLIKRANCPSGVISACYADINSGPAAGAVAGITLGAVAGFIFLLYILWILSSGSNFIRTSAVEEEDIVVSSTRRRRTDQRRRHHRSRSRGGPAVQQPPPPVEVRERSPRRDRVVRQERIIRDRVDSIPPPREPSRIREIVVESSRPPPMERRVDGDDVVEVFEEHSELSGMGGPPPRRKSRRGSEYR